ncbi:type II toxin-antitoxin system RelE/ParE family toxin [Lentilactobacillus parakefiri]|uniref:type II toxin-antitoxin system RelE/ParE family toxin n=1 Tax=Lentilactobacillus parakefiri TaxID=152332 RepID=UPI000B351BD1|nr:type II toxin-antitoxin system YafQ family toxin [Lentilactobacillus parakefiri]PAL01528.1 addiction module toxin RelE [Lentilactobacillus parakefiri]
MEILRSRRFIRELKRLSKQHYPVNLIVDYVTAIEEKDEITLRRIKDHPLTGNWQGYREFHPGRLSTNSSVLDQWIVVYLIDSDHIVLTLVTTGSHDILR